MTTHPSRHEELHTDAEGEGTALLPAVGVAGLLFTPTAVIGALLYFFLSATPAGASDFEAGKKLFLKQKCQQCHTVSALKILKEEGGDEEEEEDGGEKRDPPDLSGVGKDHQPEWMVKYLKKIEKLEGRKHKKKFKGTDVELQSLAEWLATLKHDVPKAAAKPGAAKK